MLAKAIAKYLTDFKDTLDAQYTWEFDQAIPQQSFGITCVGDSWLDKTRELKAGLIGRIETSDSVDDLVPIAEYFIKTWGGIGGFRSAKKTVETFRHISGGVKVPANFRFNFNSISSWSKWLSLSCPKWACIYDTRVVYSINAINYLRGAGNLIFPTPEGRNTQLNMFDVSTLLLSSRIKPSDVSSPKRLRANYFVQNSAAYTTYVQLVSDVSQFIWGDAEHIHDVEMLLFSLADTHVYKDVFARIQVANVKLATAA